MSSPSERATRKRQSDIPPSGSPAAAQGARPARRTALVWSVAAVAAAGGAALAWRRLQPQRDQPPPGGASADAVPGLWTQTFETPAGGTLALAGLRGQPLLVNFWATWCPPCVEELPLLERFHRDHAARGWQVVGLAIDQPSAVRKFLGRMQLTFPIGLAGLGGTDLGRALGNDAGSLPFTVVLGADGAVRHRKMGQVTSQDLQQWAARS